MLLVIGHRHDMLLPLPAHLLPADTSMSITLSRKPNGTRPAALIRCMLILLLATPRVLLAHDFWIEPDAFRPKPGTRVALRLYVGQRFTGESIPYLPELFERYASVGPAGEQPIPGTLGDDPAGGFTPTVPGLYVVALHTRPAEVSFDSLDEFVQYLRAEGLERQEALSQQRHKAGKPVRETYFRCAKSLVAAGRFDRDARDRVLGLPLELIAETSPYRLAPGARLRAASRPPRRPRKR